MRIDKYLKVSRLIKRRTVAKEACDKGRVFVNGHPAKAGTDVKVGDVVVIKFGNSDLEFKIIDVNEKAKKEDASSLYEIIGRTSTDVQGLD
jgi:ribosomal 50S subunit-recycling heat shock protein